MTVLSYLKTALPEFAFVAFTNMQSLFFRGGEIR